MNIKYYLKGINLNFPNISNIDHVSCALLDRKMYPTPVPILNQVAYCVVYL